MNPFDDEDPTSLTSDGELYKRALDAWGMKHQIEMLIEELGELIVSIQKWKRVPSESRVLDIAGEVADVEIMLGQFHYIMENRTDKNYGVYLDEHRANKRARLETRLHLHELKDKFGENAWYD